MWLRRWVNITMKMYVAAVSMYTHLAYYSLHEMRIYVLYMVRAALASCNIVYAARSAHLSRFSALIDVQRRPSKAAMHSRYSTAYCTCSGFNLVARCVFRLVMLSVGPWHQSVGRLARGNASYGDRSIVAIARPGDVFFY